METESYPRSGHATKCLPIFQLVNISVFLRSLGKMVLLLGLAMVISVGLSAVIPASEGHEMNLNLRGWIISLSITVALAVSLLMAGYLLGRRSSRPPAMRRREAMALVGTGWFVCSCAAALPYLFCEPDFGFVLFLFV